MNEFDILLYRPLQPGTRFEGLMPKSRCRTTDLGDGMADHTIVQMEAWIRKHSWQTEKIAKILKSGSLEDNVEAIKDFAFGHFQYKADAQDQMLRSPACSWATRHEGIDCKSYSIIASCLLLNMGITHYVRKIKQPGFEPTQWTHVYVVVPKDQKTGNLGKGYYVIDGTLAEDDEPLFIETSDLLMQHYGLNGASQANGLNFSIGGFDIKSLSDIKTLIAGIDCFGGSAYLPNGLQGHLNNTALYFNTLIQRINTAVENGDTAGFATAVCEFYGNSKMFVTATERNISKGWNSCTTKRIRVNLAAFKFYRDVVGKALDAWLKQSFDMAPGIRTMAFTSAGAEARYNMRFLNVSPAQVQNEPLHTYTTKAGIANIKAFELTPYIAETVGTNATAFNPATFLQGLSKIIASFSPSGQVGGGGGTDDGYYDDEYNANIPKPTQAGFGMVGWLVLGTAAVYAISQAKTTPNKPKQASK